jgi:hypothetical protein
MENDIQERNYRARDYLTSVEYRRILRREALMDKVYPLIIFSIMFLMLLGMYGLTK